MTEPVAVPERRFQCPACPRDGSIYQTDTHADGITIHLRCVGCGHEWTVNRPLPPKTDPPG